MGFDERVRRLPRLGIGISTEFGAQSAGGLDPLELRRAQPDYAQFLEIGVETVKGIDEDARAWLASGAPCTYHFLDLNLDEAADFDRTWLAELNGLISEMKPAWICGDAGLWHFGPRERGHMLLLPPVLTDDSARELAEGIIALREYTGLEILPENPPGTAFVGDLHILDYFARVCDYADTGMLLDVAHLAMYQRVQGHAATTGLDGLPSERVIEMHVAGGQVRHTEGFRWIEDSHGTRVLPESWAICESLVPRARELRALIVECERNTMTEVLPLFARARSLWPELPPVERARIDD